MSTPNKTRKREHTKNGSKRAVSVPPPLNNRSIDKTKKMSSKRQLKKCKSKQAFEQQKQVTRKAGKKSKLQKKLSSPGSKNLFKDKSSVILPSETTHAANNAYFPNADPKTAHIQSSRLLSTQSQYSLGGEFAVQKNSYSSKTLCRQNSKQTLCENKDALSSVLARARKVLQGYRERCSILQRNNLRLQQQLNFVKRPSVTKS